MTDAKTVSILLNSVEIKHKDYLSQLFITDADIFTRFYTDQKKFES